MLPGRSVATFQTNPLAQLPGQFMVSCIVDKSNLPGWRGEMRGCGCGDCEVYRLVIWHSAGQKYTDISVEVKVDGGKGMEGVTVYLWIKRRNSGECRDPWIFRLCSGYRWCRGSVRGVRRERCQKRGKVRWTLLEGADEGHWLGLPGGRVFCIVLVVRHPWLARSVDILSVTYCQCISIRFCPGDGRSQRIAQRRVLDECHFSVVDTWLY